MIWDSSKVLNSDMEDKSSVGLVASNWIDCALPSCIWSFLWRTTEGVERTSCVLIFFSDILQIVIICFRSSLKFHQFTNISNGYSVSWTQGTIIIVSNRWTTKQKFDKINLMRLISFEFTTLSCLLSTKSEEHFFSSLKSKSFVYVKLVCMKNPPKFS